MIRRTLLLVAGLLACSAKPNEGAMELTIRGDLPGSSIQPEIYGAFAEHLGSGVYDGLWVGKKSPIKNVGGIRSDVIDALKALHLGVLRWPGGCFADQYHWRDGIGPQESRPKRLNVIWGGEESNEFGTHEFFKLCDLIGAKPYLAANVGSGTPMEMRDWLEYLTSDSNSALANERRQNGQASPWKVPYLGIGNESWGCGGNMRAEYYADLYRQFATFAQSLSGNHVSKIASGSSDDDYNWTETLMRQAGGHLDGLSLHHYSLPTGQWGTKGRATGFSEKEWYDTLRQALLMETLIQRHGAIMDKYDAKKRVNLVVDEWGTWYDPDPSMKLGALSQPNTMRDAVVAAINLNLFNQHCDRVRMACMAQSVNVLQSLLLVKGNQVVKTPTYYVFDLFKQHEGSTLLPVEGQVPGADPIPNVSVSASKDASGSILVTIANLNATQPVRVNFHVAGPSMKSATGQLLAGDTFRTGNDFNNPNAVVPRPLTGLSFKEGVLACDLPAASVAAIRLEK
ncbi:alpha-N-arabinofuranosidase [Fimbriimonas ginsengisoli]|uniref:non-reducing end alpha-L-arabinofuranosidase n=1 Tax=Fimbriimonas ginsengisoli Gsoil 348 TaxID=661478 RepID=A0A068NJK7_FIMGI|nr:alpha-L-arabinofuranosidase C-terminal domain-containing protein [Fimbriimonas ginsengisoli]AIE83686.1 alpha-L-arabinofuranosidase domain-containing protein [Fimbriimonas ginsengisoli Gsoil 348]